MADETHLMSSATLAGDKVFNLAGENVGKIEDFLLDLETGRIAYAVLSFGGVFGIGDKLFAVPPEALTHDSERKCFILDADKKALHEAPSFERNNWPDFTDRTWASHVYSHYGRKPYWT